MRIVLTLPLAALLAATPALAQDRATPHRAPNLDQAATLLANPAVQDGLAALIGQVADAVLQTRVGPLAVAADRRDDVRASDTLGDVIRRDDPGFDRRVRANTRRSLAIAGGAARGAADMTRELQATADRLRAVLGTIDRRAGGD